MTLHYTTRLNLQFTDLRRRKAVQQESHHFPTPVLRGRGGIFGELFHRLDVQLSSQLGHLQPWSVGSVVGHRYKKCEITVTTTIYIMTS